MEFFEFAITVIIISVSGVMSPGPLFAANIAYGLKGGVNSGLKIAHGHLVAELPLVFLIGFGILSLESLPLFGKIISLLGAISLFIFAGIQVKNVLRKTNPYLKENHGPFITGISLSILNPFFLIWWFTIGLKLISEALVIASFAGIGIMFLLHIWLDYSWLGIVSFLASKGKKIFSNNRYKIFVIGISGFLIYFGIVFALEAIG